MSSLKVMTKDTLADTLTPVSAYMKICGNGKDSCLLESGEMSEAVGRFSVVAWDPLCSITLLSGGVRLDLDGEESQSPRQEFFPLMRRVMERLKCAGPPGLPLVGALVGYVGWDAVRLIERLPGKFGVETPAARLFFPSRFVIFDHIRRIMTLVTLAPDKAGCQAKMDETEARLRAPLETAARPAGFTMTAPPKERYIEAVTRAKEYILAGDIFQVVLSDRFRGRTGVDPLTVYRWLRVKSPSPYMFFLDFGDQKLVGASPETLVKVENGIIGIRPIAGTRGRSADPVRDKELEREMLESEKERAEHVMLVDLSRNDAGRVSRYGTVEVAPYMTVERFSHVMHIVSHVSGELRPDLDVLDAFQAGFPAGTVSGAPKVRAMEIIDELEQGRARGPYAGAVGYFGPGRRMDTCIAIRMLQFQGDEFTVQVGAGIVADSIPEMEYEEINHKAAQSLAALKTASKG